jgi:PucR family transcriptional regulator, purine catabolism regulatory protein
VPALVSLLSLELERRHLAGEPERRRRASVLGRLLQGRTDAARAREMLEAAGLVSQSVRVVALGPGEEGSTPMSDLVADLAPAVRGGLVRVHQGAVEAVVGDDVDVPVLLERFAPGHPAGVGAAVTADALPVSQRQARSLVEVSRRRGRPVTESESRSVQFLLELGDRGSLQGFADSVLAAVDASGSAQTLLRTLRVWLEMQGSWDRTASRLQVHRHTVRNRIDRVGVLTGRAMDRSGDRMDLWLALHAREVAGVASD